VSKYSQQPYSRVQPVYITTKFTFTFRLHPHLEEAEPSSTYGFLVETVQAGANKLGRSLRMNSVRLPCVFPIYHD